MPAAIIQQLGARAATESDQVPNRISLTDHDGKLSCEGLPNPLLGFLLPQSPGAPVKVTDANGVESWECDYLNNSVLGSFWRKNHARFRGGVAFGEDGPGGPRSLRSNLYRRFEKCHAGH